MIPSIVARVSYMGLTFLAGVLLAAVAMPHDFGSISLIILNATLFYTLSAFGTESAIMLSSGKHNWSVGKAVTGIWYTFIFQLLAFTGLQAVMVQFFHISLLTLKDTHLIKYEFLYFIGLMLVEKYTILYYSFNKANTCNILLSITAAFYLGITVALYANWLSLTVHPFAIVALVTLAQGVSLLLAFHLKKGISFESLSKQDWSGLFSISLLVLACNLVQLIAYRFDYWYIESSLTTADVGIYAQANRFAQLLWTLPNIVSFILIPKLLKKDNITDFVPLFNTLSTVNLALSLVVILAGLFFYKTILPSAYLDGLYLLLLMLPGYVLFACAIPIAALFSAKGKLKLNLYGSLFCLVLIVVLDILLIPVLGYWGAALGNLIAYSLSALYLFACYGNYTDSSVFPLLKLQFRYSSFDGFR